MLLREDSAAAPDGLTTDATGAVWTAMFGGAEIRRYAEDGDLLARIQLPASQPTSLALHGSRALVTTARLGLDGPTPHDGLLLSIQLDSIPGIPTPVPVCAFG